MDAATLKLAKNYTNEQVVQKATNSPVEEISFDGGIYSVGNNVVNGQVSVVLKGNTWTNRAGVGDTSPQTITSLDSAKTYLLIKTDGGTVNVDGVDTAVPAKITGKTSTVLTWASGKIALYELSTTEAALDAAVLSQKYHYVSGTKSTNSVRVKSVGKNLFDESKLESVNNHPNLVWDGKVLSLYDGYANSLHYSHSFFKYVRSLLKVGHTYTSTRTIERLSGDSGIFGSVRFYNNTYGSFEIFAQGDGDRKKTFTVPEDFFEKWGTSPLIFYGTLDGTGEQVRISRLQIEESSTSTPYEPYKESSAIINLPEPLRSLPKGVKDEISVSDGKLIKKIGSKVNVASGTVINYADMVTSGQFVAYYADGTQQVGLKGDTLTADAVTLTYQLAQPIITKLPAQPPLQVFENGTVYVEPIGDPAESTVPSVEMTIPTGTSNKFGVASHDYDRAAADWTLTNSESKCFMLAVSNAGGEANIIAPNRPGTMYAISNASGYAITIKISDGIGVAVADSKTVLVIHNGTDYTALTAEL